MKNGLRLLFAVWLLVVYSLPLLAQNRMTVKGKVSDEKGAPIPFASVTIKGSGGGVSADAEGIYSIDVPQGSNVRLIVSAVGFEDVEIAAGTNAVLKSGTALSEVVVTAFGVKQKRKALGFATQEVSNRELLESKQLNVVNALQGRVAGVQVTNTGGGPGQSARIVIRGIKGLDPTANNQPLFVIDGIIMDNSTFTEGGSAALRGMTNRAADINPEDIESVSILRGGAATALYGIGAANGVVLITTKSAQAGKMRVSFATTFGVEEVNKFPDVQSTFTQGWHTESYTNPQTGVRLQGYNPNSFWPAWGTTVAEAKAVDPTHPDQLFNHYGRAYESGWQTRNTVLMSGGTEKAMISSSLSYNYHKGVLPNTDFTSINARVNAQLKLSSKLSFNPSILYTNSGGTRYNADRFGESLTYWSPRWDVRDYINEDGTMKTYGNNNPIYGAYTNLFKDNVDRIITSANFVYNPISWLNVNYRFGMDNTADFRRSTKPGPIGVPGEIVLSDGGLLGVSGALGSVGEYRINNRLLNSNLLITANRQITDKLNAVVRVGNEVRDRKFSYLAAEGAELDIPDLLSLNNAKVRSNNQRIEQERSVSFYGDATLSWDNFLFLNGSIRNDRVSNLPIGNNSFYYPSVSLSYVFSQHLKMPSWLTFGKLRASYSQIGIAAPSPYLTNTYYSNPFGQPIGTVIPWSRENQRGDPFLKPEFTQNREIGAELKFLNNRLGVDVTYYVINSKDLIVPILVSTASGFNSVRTNAGEIQNKGWEFTLNGTPVESRDFRWDINVNLTNNNNKVLKVSDQSNEIIIGSQFGYIGATVTQKYVVGQPVGGLYGTSYARYYGDKIDDGVTFQPGLPWIIQGGTSAQRGYPTRDTRQRLLGNSQPRWLGGINNSFTYKNFNLAFLFDFRSNYQKYNQLGNFMSAFGIADYTENRRETVVFPGVLADGTPNTQEVWLGQGVGPDARNYGDGYYRIIHRSLSENFVEDADWIRLRTLTIGYNLPSKWFAKSSFIKSMNANITGNNLWLSTPYSGFDPETSATPAGSNLDGFAGFSYPAVRSVFFNVNVNF
jgi:TonB-linked SusC/RagA family outer membrane protein